MRHSESIDKLAPALVAIAASIKGIEKDKLNPHFKSNYLSLDGLTAEVRPICASHGVAIVQGGGEVANGGISVGTTLLHESGQWVSESFEMPLEKATPQAAGSAITYGRRYSLAAILAISNEEDDDGNAASKPATRQRAASRQTMSDTSKGNGADAITRESKLTFGSKEGTAIKELSDTYLTWGLEEGRNLGPRTKDWQAAFRAELASRDGVVAKT